VLVVVEFARFMAVHIRWVDWLRGSFLAGADIGDYVADFTDDASFATSIPMDGDPPAGTGYYFLVKAGGPSLHTIARFVELPSRRKPEHQLACSA